MVIISVIIPTWNRAKETKRAVQSVLNQTFQDFEIIIADDGSTDQTKEVFANYPDSRVNFLQLTHSGLPAIARNAALHQAKGELVAFLDSDDEWLPQKLSTQIRYFDSHPDVELVCTNANIIRAGKKLGLFFQKSECIYDTLVSLVEHSNFIITSSVMTRNNLLKKYGGFSEEVLHRGVEDFDLWLKLCTDNYFHYIKQPLVNYTDNQNQNIRSEISKIEYQIGMLNIYEKAFLIQHEKGILTNSLERLLFRRSYCLREELKDWKINQPNYDSQNYPEVSIILPVYNGEKYILESVFSILNQTYQNLELIVINDGSTDQTQQLLESVKDARLRIVKQNNQGIVASLNNGFNMAKGKYLARQDHDDIALPTRIEKQVHFLEENPEIGLIGTCAEVWGENNSHIRDLKLPFSDFLLRIHLLFENPFIHSSIMIRRTIVDNVGAYSSEFALSAMEDFELWSRVSRICKVANLQDQLEIYREVPTSITKNVRNNFHFRKEIVYNNFSQWIEIGYNKDIISHLAALAIGDSTNMDPFICFYDCRIFLNETINQIIKYENREKDLLSSEVTIILNQLRRNHFSLRMHLPWRVILQFEKLTGVQLLNFFENWEKKAPKLFKVISNCTSILYDSMLSIIRIIINLTNPNKRTRS